ncbi:hypothetical protein FHW16_003434 [Phyllobacterium myrsinacearum]|uniref:Glycine zipper domain-containing protein n=1 Tax=Phyllobacterium myrsinacearum TaxID=28101 RepID=A0A839ENE1_9HYPH|nr:hypothetical protein [Phyllobacterium myrsinacearum]
MRNIVFISCIALMLAGCQTAQESAVEAKNTCDSAGLKPGSKAHRRCVSASYEQNRRQSNEAGNAAALGAAVGVLGGVALGAAVERNHYPGYYRRCGPWGCYY